VVALPEAGLPAVVAQGAAAGSKTTHGRNLSTSFADMETPDHQDWRSRQRISVPAILKKASGLGLYLFIFSGGTPWTSGGVARGVVGWTVAWPWALILVSHFALCFATVALMALAIYRLHWVVAVLVGPLVSLAVYAFTVPLFALQQPSDGRAFSAFLVLGLFGAAIYKALSVPPPHMSAQERQEISRTKAH
jgi:hypothetical protein